VVVPVDEAHDIESGVGVVSESVLVEEFRFEGGEERFRPPTECRSSRQSHQTALPLLRTIGDRYELLGSYGAGYVAKIASVTLGYLHSVCLVEALLLGLKGGVDPARGGRIFSRVG
jgi:hypothetical protein